MLHLSQFFHYQNVFWTVVTGTLSWGQHTLLTPLDLSFHGVCHQFCIWKCWRIVIIFLAGRIPNGACKGPHLMKTSPRGEKWMTLTFLGGKSGFPLCLLNHQVIQAGFQEGLWNSDVIEALKAWRMCRIWEGNFW